MDIKTNVKWIWEMEGNGDFTLIKAVSHSRLEEDGVVRECTDFDHYSHRQHIARFAPKEMTAFLADGMTALARGW